MASVTSRIAQIKQPQGGYIKVSSFRKIKLDDDGKVCDPSLENVSASLIGMTVDYLTRFMITKNLLSAFKISRLGAQIMNETSKFSNLLKRIKGLDDSSIFSALQIVGYDCAYRAGPFAFRPIESINPNKTTIENVRLMVERSLGLFNKYGPIVLEGFSFEGAYTNVIDSGDGDYLTADTLWDFKVSKNEPNTNQTLQLLVYYLLGKKSIHREFDKIQKLAIYNPRFNIAYIFDTNLLEQKIIDDVEENVIGRKTQRRRKEDSDCNLIKLEKYIFRDKAKAEAALLRYGPKSKKAVFKEPMLTNIFERAKNNDEENVEKLANMLFYLGNNLKLLDFNIDLSNTILVESIYCALILKKINAKKGTLLLAELLGKFPSILNSRGKNVFEADEIINSLEVQYLKEAWEDFHDIRSGEKYARKLLTPMLGHYYPEEGIDVLQKLEKENHDLLSPLFYTTLGMEYIRGKNVTRNVDKAKELFKKAYELGDKGAIRQMNNLLERYKSN